MRRGDLARCSLPCILGTIVSAFAAPPPTYHLAVDVPARLSSTDYQPNQVVLQENYQYSLGTNLPALLQVNGLLRFKQGWWVSPLVPTELCGVTYQPRDVVQLVGSTCVTKLDGSVAGIPPSSRIDAIAQQTIGLDTFTIISFDVPTTIGSRTFLPSDLVRHSGGTTFLMALDGAATGIPPGVNVVGAEWRSGSFYVSFDVPVTLSGVDFAVGSIARWTGSVWELSASDPAWPPAVQIRDFAFGPPPVGAGAVPDGRFVPGAPLTARKNGSQVILDWSAACNGLTSEVDYAVYRGRIGSWYGHDPITCSTGGARTFSDPYPSFNAYYLIVARNPEREGSHGRDSRGVERPAPVHGCAMQQIQNCP